MLTVICELRLLNFILWIGVLCLVWTVDRRLVCVRGFVWTIVQLCVAFCDYVDRFQKVFVFVTFFLVLVLSINK